MLEPTPPVLDELRAKLVSSFEQKEASEAAHRQSPRRRVVLGAVAVAVISTALVVLITSSNSEHGPLSVESAAADVAAATLDSSQPPTNSYVHERTVGRSVQSYFPERTLTRKPIGVFSAINESLEDDWANPFRCSYSRGLSSRTLGYPSAGDASRARQWEQAVRKSGGGGSSPVLLQSAARYVLTYPPQESLRARVQIGGERLTADQLDDYPTTPQAIHDRIERSLRSRRGSVSTDTHVWNALAWTPSNYGPGRRLPAALRAGLVLALGEIPGVKVTAEHVTSSGAKAITFIREAGGIRHELTLDKSSGVALASKDTIIAPQGGKMSGWPNGTVFRSRTVLDREIVEKVPRSIIRRARTQPGAMPVAGCR